MSGTSTLGALGVDRAPVFSPDELATIPADDLVSMALDVGYIHRELDRQADALRRWRHMPADARNLLYWHLHGVMDGLDELGRALHDEHERRKGGH